MRPPLGTDSAAVTPSARVIGISTDWGLIPSATLKAGFTSPVLTASRVSATEPTSNRPRLVQAWISPGVTHLPVASTRVAPSGIATA